LHRAYHCGLLRMQVCSLTCMCSLPRWIFYCTELASHRGLWHMQVRSETDIYVQLHPSQWTFRWSLRPHTIEIDSLILATRVLDWMAGKLACFHASGITNSFVIFTPPGPHGIFSVNISNFHMSSDDRILCLPTVKFAQVLISRSIERTFFSWLRNRYATCSHLPSIGRLHQICISISMMIVWKVRAPCIAMMAIWEIRQHYYFSVIFRCQYACNVSSKYPGRATSTDSSTIIYVLLI
jgi:hypothetical protein